MKVVLRRKELMIFLIDKSVDYLLVKSICFKKCQSDEFKMLVFTKGGGQKA